MKKNNLKICIFITLLILFTGITAVTATNTTHTIQKDTITTQNPTVTIENTTSEKQVQSTTKTTTNTANNLQTTTDTNTVKTQNDTTNNIQSTTTNKIQENKSTTTKATNTKTAVKKSTEVTVNNYNELNNAILTAKESSDTSYTIKLNDGDYSIINQITWGKASGTLRNLTILGNNQIIDGNNRYTFINISPGYTLNIEDITIQNTHTDQSSTGGAISGETCNLTINNSYFINCTAVTGTNGGAISLTSNSNLTINNSQFENNTVTAGTSGAIYLLVVLF